MEWKNSFLGLRLNMVAIDRRDQVLLLKGLKKAFQDSPGQEDAMMHVNTNLFNG